MRLFQSQKKLSDSSAFLKAHFSDIPELIERVKSSTLELKDAIGIIDSLLKKQVPGPKHRAVHLLRLRLGNQGAQFHPHKLCIAQQLYEKDYEQWKGDVIRIENNVVIMSDEDHYYLDEEYV
ncbi:hypothetical protein FQA39_LY03425 [Lamprigera yunnana]|nr:hypothetical protein FQA39_LY03425 [Lamprigera yunnana]